MCGIAGEINFDHPERRLDPQSTDKILRSLKRRGPDQDGVFRSGPATLIHARLAVIDPEHGLQPMKTEYGDRSYIMVYNGELYNTNEIRDALRAKGHHFDTHSDTEVLLKAYVEWDEDCVKRLNGIFAFAVWDTAKQALFFARDRMGVKPFFYSDTPFIFASELGAMLSHPGVTPVIDSESVAELLLIGPGRTPGYGVFKEVRELLPGWCGTYSEEGLLCRPYWKLEDREHPDSYEQTVERVRYLVRDAIERQLVSDVPICTFLSGGLDSSIISALAAKSLAAKGEKLKTFSVHYAGNDKYFQPGKFQPNSDDAYIGIMSDYLGTDHRRIELGTDDLIRALYDAVDARGLPGMADVDSSLLLFCREVKREATVALSGECADEIFGGYPWFRDETIRVRNGFPWAQSTQYRSAFLREEYAEKLDPQDYVYAKYLQSVADVPLIPGQSEAETGMKIMTALNMRWFMQTLLERKDAKKTI